MFINIYMYLTGIKGPIRFHRFTERTFEYTLEWVSKNGH